MGLGVIRLAETMIASSFGGLSVTVCSSNGASAIVAHRGNPEGAPFVRIHSACLFGEVLGAVDCECQHQLNAALGYISIEGGYLIYLYQEGRGVGLLEKVRAIEIERSDQLNTAEAFRRLGHVPDPRDYGLAIEAMAAMRLPPTIRLMTNNPRKIAAVESAGYAVIDRLEPTLRVSRTLANEIQRRQESLGHIPYRNLIIEEGWVDVRPFGASGCHVSH